MLKKLPDKVQNFIDRYFYLNINEARIQTPYFINLEGFMKSPVYSGKGTPEEIEAEVYTLIAEKDLTPDQVLELMREKGLGIDCSGLVYNVYDYWLVSEGKKSLRDFLPGVPIYNLRKYISRKIKPQNSISANELTSEPFSQRIEVKDAQPGDLIRTKSGKHVLLITEIQYDQSNLPVRIKYVESGRFYKRDGMRYGEIILDPSLNLTIAKWELNDVTEPVNYAYEGWREGVNTNGVFRPKFLLNQ